MGRLDKENEPSDFCRLLCSLHNWLPKIPVPKMDEVLEIRRKMKELFPYIRTLEEIISSRLNGDSGEKLTGENHHNMEKLFYGHRFQRSSELSKIPRDNLYLVNMRVDNAYSKWELIHIAGDGNKILTTETDYKNGLEELLNETEPLPETLRKIEAAKETFVLLSRSTEASVL